LWSDKMVVNIICFCIKKDQLWLHINESNRWKMGTRKIFAPEKYVMQRLHCKWTPSSSLQMLVHSLLCIAAKNKIKGITNRILPALHRNWLKVKATTEYSDLLNIMAHDLSKLSQCCEWSEIKANQQLYKK
jgi:hypothetical protein